MKKIFILLLLPCFCNAQDIPKFANTIFVKGVTFAQVKSALLDSAYFIDLQNEQDGTIITTEKNVDPYRLFGQNTDRWHIILNIRVKDSIAKISGQIWYVEQKPKQWRPIEYWRSTISAPHAIFMNMDKVAQSLHGQVTYAKL